MAEKPTVISKVDQLGFEYKVVLYPGYKRAFGSFALKHSFIMRRGSCPKCGCKTVYRIGHVKRHGKTRRYRCRACGKSFYYPNDPDLKVWP